MKNLKELQDYCEKHKTKVLDRKGNKVILDNGEILEVNF